MGLLTRMTIAAALLVVLAPAAHAQDYAPAPPISSADMINYCVYGGLIYSVGSQMCIVRGGPPLYCEQALTDPRNGVRARAAWTTNQPPGTLNCSNDTISGGPATPYMIRRSPAAGQP